MKRRVSCRAKERKSLQPVSERSVPGQSIKNVSRAEIIKVRIYIYKRAREYEGGPGEEEEMYDAKTRKGDDRKKERRKERVYGRRVSADV